MSNTWHRKKDWHDDQERYNDKREVMNYRKTLKMRNASKFKFLNNKNDEDDFNIDHMCDKNNKKK